MINHNRDGSHHCERRQALVADALSTNLSYQIAAASRIEKSLDLRRPGIEPGPHAWKARILTIELSTHVKCYVENPGFDPGASTLLTLRSSD